MNWSAGRRPKRNFTLRRDRGREVSQAPMRPLIVVSLLPILQRRIDLLHLEVKLSVPQLARAVLSRGALRLELGRSCVGCGHCVRSCCMSTGVPMRKQCLKRRFRHLQRPARGKGGILSGTPPNIAGRRRRCRWNCSSPEVQPLFLSPLR